MKGKMFLGKKKFFIGGIAGALALLIIALIVINVNMQEPMYFRGENARAMTYDQFTDGDEAINGTDNVTFSAFFLRDLDGDGYAEKIKGTCKEIGTEDTMYMELKVQTAGYLKNGKIEIQAKNFYIQTALPEDEELKQSYIGNNIKEIEFKDINNGTQKLITGVIRSGDYSSEAYKTAAIGDNINNYSVDDNKIILTGTYVGTDGIEKEIRKEINLETDWYGSTVSGISGNKNYFTDLSERINNTINLDIKFDVNEQKGQLLVSKNYTEGTIPNLNGYAPIEVTSNSNGFSYDESTNKFTFVQEAITNSEGKIIKSLSRNIGYSLKIKYPIEAYNSSEILMIKIPVTTYFEGYNNSNSEFENPYVSNIASATIIATFTDEENNEIYSSYEIEVGKKVDTPQKRKIVSKEKPLKIYNGLSSEEVNDYYTVCWKAYTGSEDVIESLILKETSSNNTEEIDTFIKTDATEIKMDNIVNNVGIYFNGADYFLSEDGYIKVFNDETNELLVTFTKENWSKYTYANPYKYSIPVKHIRVETSGSKNENGISIYHIKELDDIYITDNFTKSEFDTFDYIKSNLAVYANNNLIKDLSGTAIYEQPYSIAELKINNDNFSTQKVEENQIITIDAQMNILENKLGWIDGSFLIKFPKEILNVEINNVIASNETIEILSYELIEKDNCKFIKINTQNKVETQTTYQIILDIDIVPDPRIETTIKEIELYASNENNSTYYYSKADIYDVNDNLKIEEFVNYDNISINLISPNTLLTNQIITNFDDTNDIIVSPEIADTSPIYAVVDNAEREATIGVQIKNNYSSAIDEVIILGKIPFEGNTYVLNEADLKSTFSTKMKSPGIQVPTQLQGKVTIYYSENEKTTRDVSELNNGWSLAENVTNWDNIKTFLIVFDDYILSSGEEIIFYYTVEIPENISLNKIAYSHHGVYFSLNTPEGKYTTQVEPAKIGLKIAEKFDLKLLKTQKGKDILIPQAVYKITEILEDGTEGKVKTGTTNSNGILNINKLYAETVYELQEIKAPAKYSLNEDIVKFIVHVDENGSFTVEKIQGESKEDISISKIDEKQVVNIKVEDEVKANIKIIKIDNETKEKISGVRYNIKGDGLPETGKIITTNSDGEAYFEGLEMNKEYILTEVKAEGYYLSTTPIKIKVTNGSNGYELQVIEGERISDTLEDIDGFPLATITLGNDKIPTCSINIKKISNNNTEGIEGATFGIYNSIKKIGEYTTDSEGNILIDDLYVSDENEKFTYTIKEIIAPKGYTKIKNIVFYIEKVNEQLQMIITDGEIVSQSTSSDTVSIIIEEIPSFKLYKKDGETGEVLPNTKFVIYNIKDGVESPAIDDNNNYVGTKEIINEKEYYVVTTNENGLIEANLQKGLYKVIEVQASNEKYELAEEYYFGVDEAFSGETVFGAEYTAKVDDLQVRDSIVTQDNGVIVVAYYEDLYINDTKIPTVGNDDGIVIKYDENLNAIWYYTIGTTSNEYLYRVTELTDGSILVVGTLGKSDTIDGQSLSSKKFILKLNSNGQKEWIKQEDQMTIMDVAPCKNDGGYYVSGYFTGSISLGSDIFTSQGGNDNVLIKYNSNGEYEWGRAFGGEGNESYSVITETTKGDIVLAAYTSSANITIDGGTTTLVDRAQKILVTRYDSQGNFKWIHNFGTTRMIDVNEIETDKNDGVYIAGTTQGTTTIFDTGETLKAVGVDYADDAYIIRYNAEGNLIWTERPDGMDYGEMIDITSMSDGGVATVTETGTYMSGNIPKVVVYTEDGTEIWSKIYRNIPYLWAVSSGENGAVYVSASTYDRIDTGNCIVSESFITKYDYIEKKEKYIKKEEIIFNNNGTELDFFDVEKTLDNGFIGIGGPNSIYSTVPLFIAKYDENNNIEWSKVYETEKRDSITRVKEVSDGYLATFELKSSQINLDGMILYNESTDTTYSDTILVKYDKSGNVVWARKITGDKNEIITSLEVDETGIVIAGYFDSTEAILNPETKFINTDGKATSFIIKYDLKGKIIWYKKINGTAGPKINNIAINDENIAIVGETVGTGEINVGVGKLEVPKYSGAFIINCDNFGEYIWGNLMCSNMDDSFSLIELDEDGNLIAAGYHEGVSTSVSNGILNIGNVYGYTDDKVGIILKYNKADGLIEWHYAFEESDNRIQGLQISEDKIYVCLYEDNNIEILNEGSMYGYIFIKFDNNGELIYAQKITDSYQRFMVKDDNNICFVNSGGRLVNYYKQTSIPKIEELTVENYVKKFEITTTVKAVNGVKGGSISGENEKPYEIVKYGENNLSEIKMVPNEGYEIVNITVNGKEHEFVTNEDGTYTMPTFNNITEDKQIVVTYILKSNKITINKIDKETQKNLTGAIFNLKQVDEREEPINVIGEMTANGTIYSNVSLGEEVTDFSYEVINNGTYHFVEQDGTYVPTNSKTWQTANVEGATTGVQNSTANSYVEIDLTEKTGNYVVVVNALQSSEGVDIGYATITTDTIAPAYTVTTNRFMYASGTVAATDYTSMSLIGGNKYYLHLGYRKDSSVDTGNDQIVINSIKLFNATETKSTYNFIENEGTYESNNQGIDNTVANSYMVVDLSNYTGKYDFTVNAIVSSQSGYDYGYATVTTSETAPVYNSSTGRFIYISGTSTGAKDYTTVLEGGTKYYIHFGYYKSPTTSTGDDKFVINSVNLSLNSSELYNNNIETNINGKAITELPYGKYIVAEMKAPDGYELNKLETIIEFRENGISEFSIENTKKAKIIVNHKKAINNGDGTYTYTDEVIANQEIYEGSIGESYSSSPNLNISRYYLIKDETGKYIIPENATGVYEYNDIEINYYYEVEKIPLKVNHYIEGTEERVLLKDGTTSEEIISYGYENEQYTTNCLMEDELHEKFELIENPVNSTGVLQYEEVIVNYYYRIKDFDITTEVNGIGGTISGEGESSFENVKYGENSVKEISIIPEYSYKVKDIKINGIETEFVENANKTVTLPIFNEVKENKHIIVTFEKMNSKVTTYHYIVGTTTKVPNKTQDGVVEAVVNINSVGEIYETTASDDIADYYELVSTTNNTKGIYTIENQEVYYYYDLKSYGYTVEYYYDGNIDESKTVTGNLKFESQVETYTDKVIEGYVFEKTEGLPLTITSNADNNVIKVYYVRRADLSYTVKYLEEGTEIELATAKTIENQTFGDKVTESAIDIEGYDKVEPTSKEITIATSGNEIIFYYTKRTDLSYTVNYLEKDTNEVLAEAKVVNNQTYKDTVAETAIEIVGYDKVEPTEQSIVIEVEGNVINFYYTKRTDLSYTVNYLEKGSNEVLAEAKVVSGQTYKSEVTETAIEISGYDKVDPTEQSIVIEVENNVINFYYTKRTDLSYTVNYLEKDTNEILAEAKVVNNQTYKDTVVETAIDIDGYDKVDPTEQTIVIEVEGNVINFYYTKRSDLSYKVEYYFNNVKDESLTYVVDNQVFDTEITTYEDKIKPGYKFEKDTLPMKVTTGENIISVYYVTDASQTKELYYTVEYYKDGILDTTDTETKTVQLLEQDVLEVIKDNINLTDKYFGYRLEKTEPSNIPEQINSGEVIRVYYIIDDGNTKTLSYTVNYYKDGVKQEADTQVESFAVQILKPDTITVLKDKINIVDKYYGYKLSEETIVPDTVENGDEINIYYITDESQTKELKYTVEYYKDGDLADSEEEKEIVQVLKPDVLAVNKERINLVDKYEGYVLDNTEPEVIPDTVDTNTVIKVNYVRRSDLSYTVKYLEQGTNNVLATEKVVNNQTFGETATETAIEISGYDKVEPVEQSIVIEVEGNVINFYYTKRTDLSYTVNYLEKDTNEVLTEAKVVNNQTFGENVTEKAIDIDGYDKVEETKSIVIEVEGNVINFYYTKRSDLSYKVEYYFNNVKDESLTYVVENQVFDTEITTYEDKIKPGYKFEKDTIPMIVTTGENIISVYYVTDESQTKELSYTVEYYKDGILDVTDKETKVVQLLDQDVLEVSKEKINLTDKYVGYELDSSDPEIIPDTVISGSVIKVYYVRKSNLTYTVKYLEQDTNASLATEKVVDGQTYGETVTETAIEIDGYDKVEETKSIVIDVEGNIINFYYIKRADLSYKVEYYFNNVKDESLTYVVENQVFDSEITSYENKIKPGYRFEKDTLPMVITTGENIISVYYITDESQTKELSYTVEYYKDDVLTNMDIEKATVQVLESDYINVNIDNINLSDKYFGYKLEKTEPEEIPERVENGTVIKVYYVKDTENTKTLSYTVNYYKDGIKQESDTRVENFEVQILEPDTINVVKDKINLSNKYYGYRLSEETVVPDTVENGAEINIYYVKDENWTKELVYVVEYYKNGIFAEFEEKELTVQVLDSDYLTVDKDSINLTDKYYGYKFDKVEPSVIPDTVENGTIIKVYYVTDTENTKTLNYTVNYYKDGIKQESDTQVESVTVQILDSDTIRVDKEKINLVNKYFGYKVSEETIVPDTVENGEEINIYYVRDEAWTKEISYTVEYYKEGTLVTEDTEVVKSNVQILDPDTIIVNKENINTVDKYLGYKLDTENTNEIPDIVNNGDVIRIYYIKKDAIVNVHYYEINSENKLLEDIIIEGKMFDEYYTEQKEIEGYELVQIPKNNAGIMTEDVINVNYYYAKKSDVIVKHIDKDTNEVIIEEKIPAKEGDLIETTSKDIPEYVLVEAPEETVIKVGKEDVEVIYLYVKVSAGVIEKHIDVNTEEVLDTVIYEGKVGDKYKTEPKEFEEYELVKEKYPENAEGIMTQEVIEVKYYYIRKAKVVVKHIDIITNEEIVIENNSLESTSEILEGYVGDEYKTKAKEFEGYDFVKEKYPENAEGFMTKEIIEVKYYYVRKAKVVVEHIDKLTDKIITIEESIDSNNDGKVDEIKQKDIIDIIEGHEGDKYETKAKEIDGYVIYKDELENDILPENAKGVMTKEDIIVKYYYVKVSKVIERHIDEATNELIEKEIIHNGYIGKKYDVSTKTFDKYVLNENKLPINNKGTMTEETIVVEYYYKHKAKVSAEYIDKNTGAKMKENNQDSTVVIEGYVNDPYKVERKEFENYKLVQEMLPTNESGKMTKEEIVIKYYYVHESAGVREEHRYSVTGELLEESKVHYGYEGDLYEINSKTFEKYVVDESKLPTNSKGKMTKGEIVVTYYYNKKAEVIVRYVNEENNAVLADDVVIIGYEGKEYMTEEKSFTGYNYTKVTQNKEGVMIDGEIVVTYYYKKVPETQIVTIPDTNNKVENKVIVANVTNEVTNTTVHNTVKNETYVKEEVVDVPKTGDIMPVAIMSIIMFVLLLNSIYLVKKDNKKE